MMSIRLLRLLTCIPVSTFTHQVLVSDTVFQWTHGFLSVTIQGLLLLSLQGEINDSMPEFVLERAYNIMKEQGIKDVKRVGLYGLTYKENVDDTRDSPTLQLLDCMARHLAGGLKVYDPYINEKIVDNQILDFNEFLDSVDMVIIMVGHNHLKENMARIEEKVIFDTRNACPFEHAYKL